MEKKLVVVLRRHDRLEDLMAHYAWDVHKRLADGRISSGRQYLESLGAKVSVELWTGSLKMVMGSYSTGGRVKLLVIKTGGVFMLKKFLRLAWRAFRRVGTLPLPPVPLRDFGQGVEMGC